MSTLGKLTASLGALAPPFRGPPNVHATPSHTLGPPPAPFVTADLADDMRRPIEVRNLRDNVGFLVRYDLGWRRVTSVDSYQQPTLRCTDADTLTMCTSLYDGHTLKTTLAQVASLAGQEPDHVFVDMGHRGHDYEGKTKVLRAGLSSRAGLSYWLDSDHSRCRSTFGVADENCRYAASLRPELAVTTTPATTRCSHYALNMATRNRQPMSAGPTGTRADRFRAIDQSATL